MYLHLQNNKNVLFFERNYYFTKNYIFNAYNWNKFIVLLLRKDIYSPNNFGLPNIGVRKGGFRGQPPPLKNGVQPYIHGNK